MSLRATYRLQLGPRMRFDDVRALVPYLRDLGISHLYLSPSLTARSGSTHGYDVVDPTTVSESLGGEPALRALADCGLGVILDIVPNHMGTGDENRWWADPDERVRVFDVDPETGHYRRFFDIDDLAGVRVEDPEVFELTHAKVLSLVADGVVDGLRIDHPDGLADPAGYLQRLHEAGAARVWIEKILHPGEQLRDWPVEGTVGYEFLNDVQGLFIDPAGEAPLTALYESLVGDARSFAEIALEAQLEQARGTFSREVERLRRIHDPGGLEEALARLPVYRTYVRDGIVHPDDRAALGGRGPPRALRRRARGVRLALSADLAAGDGEGHRGHGLLPLPAPARPERRRRRPRPLGRLGRGFHAANAERARRFPRNLLVTQTHDTKRSGDARARVGALSAMAPEWESHVRRWYSETESLVEDGAPDAHERYLVFQTLVAVWPITPQRLEGYIEKALREAKRNTSWVDQSHGWESRVKAFAVGLLTLEPFLEDFEPFVAEVAVAGERSALGQLLLKLTVPGVPDVYNGDELIDLSLVDPDNRRPVDWDARRSALAALRAGAEPTRATMKLHVIARALELRARRPDAFEGAYAPLHAGPDVVAFTRGEDVLVVVTLREPELGAVVEVPEGRWRNVLTHEELDLAGPTPALTLAEPHGFALFERV